jgi:Icc protein
VRGIARTGMFRQGADLRNRVRRQDAPSKGTVKGFVVDGTDRQSAPLRLVQITDCHLGEKAGTRLLNVDTDQSLAAVLALVRKQQPRIDALLLTGDLSDSGSVAAYRRVLAATAGLAAQVRWLPGNHDSAGTMRRVLGDDPRLQRDLLLGNWQIIGLDSAVPGEVGGRLAAAELAGLRDCLQREPQRHALICVHHPALPIGCAWIDGQMIANAAEFWRELAPFAQVRVVLSGHVHQEFDTQYNNVRVLATPSTCVQFAQRSADFRVDAAAPGYRWFDLHADGRVETGVERLRDYACDVDLAAGGY